MYQNTSKFPGELSQNSPRTHNDFLGGEYIVKADQIFHEILSKILLEQDFPGERKYHKNRYQIFYRRAFSRFCKNRYDFHKRPYPPRTDILQNYLVGCFRSNLRKVQLFILLSIGRDDAGCEFDRPIERLERPRSLGSPHLASILLTYLARGHLFVYFQSSWTCCFAGKPFD